MRDPMCPEVISALPLDDTRVLVAFSNGEKRIFDMSPYLEFPVFQALKSPGFFRCVRVAHGTLTWPNDADLCPETIYAKSIPEP